jgi:tetratricopeptide (TPR) repeat protein
LRVVVDHSVKLQNAIDLHLRGSIADAVREYRAFLQSEPNHPDALHNLGIIELQLGNAAEAESLLRKAVALVPQNAYALMHHGHALMRLEQADKAYERYEEALISAPDFLPAQIGRVAALVALRRSEEALASSQQLLAVAPESPELLLAHGNALAQLHRLSEALDSYDQALALSPRHLEVICSRGLVMLRQQRMDAALAAFRLARSINPDFAQAWSYEGICELLLANFNEGWRKYEWRWRSKNERLMSFKKPQWLGQEDIAGRTILLHAEQGYGDTLQFCRYALELADRGAHVILEVQPALVALLSSLGSSIHVIAAGDPRPNFDFHAPMLSLPLAFATDLHSIPRRIPYLSPDADLVQKYRSLPAAYTRPYIGLAWSGNPDHLLDSHRTIPLEILQPLLNTDATFVVLQKDIRVADRAHLAAHPNLLFFEECFGDFSGTAALTAQLDLVITIDTSAAHLAGALGLPVWILLPHDGLDWRWLQNRTDSPWYPTARLYRQSTANRWEDVVTRVRRDLEALIESHRGPARQRTWSPFALLKRLTT